MLIICEGSDGSGKTTLVNRIADTLRTAYPGDTVTVLHKGPPVEHPLDEYERPLFNYRPGTGQHVICDRWHVGEYVYPSIVQRPTAGDLAVFRHVDAFLQSRGALLVHVRPPHEINVKRLVTRGDEFVTAQQLRPLRQKFNDYMKRTTLSTLIAEVSDPFTIEDIITDARRHEAAAQPLNRFVTYVGPPRPAFLLLGDVRHAIGKMTAMDRAMCVANPRSTIDLGPTFGPYRNTSGHFLLSYLPEKLWEHGVGLANACDVDNVHALIEVLRRPRIVALGSNAWRAICKIATDPDDPHPIEGGSAPHPQYIRRFTHGYGLEYGRAVAVAAVHGRKLISWRPGK